MVLDALIAFFSLVFIFLVQLALAIADLVVGFVVYLLSLFGRKVERVTFREKYQARGKVADVHVEGSLPRARTPKTQGSLLGLALLIGSVALLFLVVFLFGKMRYRTLEVVASDGLPLPYAKFVAETDGESFEVRTDVLGELKLLKKTQRLSIRDKRYKKQSWEAEELSTKLVVERSVFGKSLDYLLEKAVTEE